MRIFLGTAFAFGGIVAAACTAHTADLGGVADGGGTAISTGEGDGGADAGFSGQIPFSCTETDSTPLAASSTAQVASAIVGTWFDCGAEGTSIIGALGGNADGYSALQLSADGHFEVLANPTPGTGESLSTPSTFTLEPSLTGPDGGSANVPLVGTYQVIDASSSLGAGAHQILFAPKSGPAVGGTFVAQLILLGSPTKIRFVFSTGPSTEDLVPAISLSFRAGVCDYTTFGSEYSFTSVADVAARLQGSWLWCAGGPPSDRYPNAVGVEFLSDGTWYYLEPDESGRVISRGAGGTVDGGAIVDHGTFQISEDDAGFATNFGVPVLSASGQTLGFLVGSAPITDQPILQKTSASY